MNWELDSYLVHLYACGRFSHETLEDIRRVAREIDASKNNELPKTNTLMEVK